MAQTVANMITDIQYELKDTQGTNYTDAELMAYINQGVRWVMREISRVWPDYWFVSTETSLATSNIVADTANYDLPSDHYQTLMVTTTDSDGDTTVRDRLTLERAQDSDADGYYEYNDDLYLCPTPSANVANGLNIYYISVPDEVTQDSDTVPLSDHFEDLVRGYVVVKCKARQEESNADFGVLLQDVKRQAQAMMTTVNTRSDEHGWTVYRRWWI